MSFAPRHEPNSPLDRLARQRRARVDTALRTSSCQICCAMGNSSGLAAQERGQPRREQHGLSGEAVEGECLTVA